MDFVGQLTDLDGPVKQGQPWQAPGWESSMEYQSQNTEAGIANPLSELCPASQQGLQEVNCDFQVAAHRH